MSVRAEHHQVLSLNTTGWLYGYLFHVITQVKSQFVARITSKVPSYDIGVTTDQVPFCDVTLQVKYHVTSHYELSSLVIKVFLSR